MSLVHHLEIVGVVFPSLSANHLLVRPCSTSTTLILLITLLVILVTVYVNLLSFHSKYMFYKTIMLITYFSNKVTY